MHFEPIHAAQLFLVILALTIYSGAVIHLWRGRRRRRFEAAIEEARKRATGPAFLVAVDIALVEELAWLALLLLPPGALLGWVLL